MNRPELPKNFVERCWLCNTRLLRGEPTRVMPGIGLTVHAACYESATEPPPPAPPPPPTAD